MAATATDMVTVVERSLFIPNDIFEADDRFEGLHIISTVTLMIKGKPVLGRLVKPMDPQPDGTFIVEVQTETSLSSLRRH